MLTIRFDDALLYASNLHRLQTRKQTEIPYIAHLLSVSSLVIEDGGDEDQAIAGLLHDAVEDQGGAKRLKDIESRFGRDVAGIVQDCTDAWTEPKPEWKERKERYLAALPQKPLPSMRVSLADKTHNARSILADYRMMGESLWSRFNGGRAGTIWYYDELAKIFSEKKPGPLADELSRTVAEFSGIL